MSLFGVKLRWLRKSQKLTQQALATEFGYTSHTYLSEVEKGRKEPSVALVLAVADRFGVTTDALLRDNIRLAGEDHDAVY